MILQFDLVKTERRRSEAKGMIKNTYISRNKHHTFKVNMDRDRGLLRRRSRIYDYGIRLSMY